MSYHISYHIKSYCIISYIISRASLGTLTKFHWISANTLVIAASDKIDEQKLLLQL